MLVDCVHRLLHVLEGVSFVIFASKFYIYYTFTVIVFTCTVCLFVLAPVLKIRSKL